MKIRKWMGAFAGIVLACGSGHLAAQDLSVQAYEEILYWSPQQPDQNVELNADLLGIAISRFKDNQRPEEHIGYASNGIQGHYTSHVTAKESVISTLGYNRAILSWKQNPYFTQKYFDTVLVGLGITSTRLENWLWRGSFGVAFAVDSGGFANYGIYNAMMWGRYTYSQSLGLHIGIVGQTIGLRKENILPILGVDYRMGNHWQLNLIFPVDGSLTYLWTRDWQVGIALRRVAERRRTGPNQPVSRAIYQYTNTGLELFANFLAGSHFNARFDLGGMMGGDLKVMNQTGGALQTLKFKPAIFADIRVAINF